MSVSITTDTSTFAFKEVAVNNGAIANGLTITITGGTFAGDNGDSLLLDSNTVTGVPAGLTPVLVKTSATTARLTFKGSADAHAHAADVSDVQVSFKAAQFATGGADVGLTGLKIDFADAAAAQTLSLVAPAGAHTGMFYNAGNLPTITGTAPDGTDKVYIYNHGGTKPIGTALVNAESDTWSFTLPADKLKQGAYHLTASTAADGKGAMSAGFAFTVDSKAPAAPTVTAIKGASSDVTPLLSGKAEKGATVEVFAGGETSTSLGTTKADAKGVWTLQVTDPSILGAADTTYLITATATDVAGNATSSKKAVNLTIDTAIATPTLVVAAPNKSTVAVSGSGEVGATVQLYGGADGALALGKPIKIGKTGNWKASVKLIDGAHQLSVVATDAAGNISGHSAVTAETTVIADSMTPTPTLALVKNGGVLTGFAGTAEAGATVTLWVGNTATSLKTTANPDGTWQITDISGFNPSSFDTELTFKAIAKDDRGNVSKFSAVVKHSFPANGPDINGTDANDTLNGTASAERIDGKAGADTIDGKGGNDTLTGGAGADTFTITSTAADTDTITDWGDGADLLAGAGFAGQTLVVMIDDASVTALDASKVFATHGVLLATGGAANDTIIGGAGADQLDGGEGDDALTGGGNDTLVGGGGGDSIQGGAGADVITGSAGNDVLTGGSGVDTFVFDANAVENGEDTITDFVFGAAGDKLDFSAFLGTTPAFYEVGGIGTTINGDGVAADATGAIPLADIANKVVLVTTTDIAMQTVDEATLFKTDGAFAAEGAPSTPINSVLLVGEKSGNNGVQVYYVTDGNSADDLSVTLVGTLSGVSLANVHANNLATL